MVKVFFMIAEDKKLEEFLKILIERLNKYFDLEIKRIGEVEIEREKKLIKKYSSLKGITVEFNIQKHFEKQVIISSEFNSYSHKNLKDLKEKMLNFLKEFSNLKYLIKAETSLGDMDQKYTFIYEFLLLDEKDQQFNDLNPDFMKPDYKEKIGSKYLMEFDSKYKKGESHDKDLVPLANETFYESVLIKHKGTEVIKSYGFKIFSFREDVNKIETLLIGRIFNGLYSGVKITDEEDLLKALKKANRHLAKYGKEIVDIKVVYDQVKKAFKEYKGDEDYWRKNETNK